MDSTVYIVHSVDAEGPLTETLEATFERIEVTFGRRFEPSQETLARLQRRELDLGGQEDAVARLLDPQFLAYNSSWEAIDAMLEDIGSVDFRNALPDSEGNGWVYTWHCLDHVGYLENPRRRDVGYHKVFDRYRSFVQTTHAPDGIEWHFHPTHPSGAGHRSGTLYLRDTKFFDVLTRRLIDRAWFPSVNRAGFDTERADSHWLLEQWMPFDLSNQAYDTPDDQPDLKGGRFGDWRRAPGDWSIYRPEHDDYQVPGNCRRYIARCLNVGTRYRLLDERELRKAFERARREGPTLLALTDHDFRDMRRDVTYVHDLLRRVIPDYQDVGFRYCEAREAMNRVLWGDYQMPASNILSVTLQQDDDSLVMAVEASEATFGPQPFLAIKTASGQYIHDNFDVQEPFRRWTYVFDELTLPWSSVARVGIATNDRRGFSHVRIIPDAHEGG